MERGVGQEGGRPVSETWAWPGLDNGLSGGWQRGWGREIRPTSTSSNANAIYFFQREDFRENNKKELEEEKTSFQRQPTFSNEM